MPIHVLGVQKISAGAVQSFLGALIVFPIVLVVHAAGQAPHRPLRKKICSRSASMAIDSAARVSSKLRA